MRFLCEQCKAKYQISDDKVAGKTVRMKCRKCGHMIEVRSDITETSVANAAPADPLKAVATAGAPAAKPGTLPRPATKPIPPRSKLATSLTSSQPKAANPSALAGAFQRTVAGAPASSMRPAHNPDDSQALDMLSASANPWYVAINGVPVGPVRLSELRRKAQSGIVTESSLVWQEGVEEWRPVKTFPELAQIVREAAASGRPSLVPGAGERVSQPPGAPSNRPSAPTAARAPLAPRASVAPARSNVVPIGSRAAAAVAEPIEEMDFEADDRDKTTVDVGHSPGVAAGVAASFVPAAGVRPSVAPDPFAAPRPAAAAQQQGGFGQGLGGTMVLPGGPSAPMQPPARASMQGPMQGSAPAPILPSAANPIANPYRAQSISMAPIAPQSKSPNWTVLALLFAAVAFGVTAAIVVFSRPQVVVQTVGSSAPTAPASASATASIAASDIPPPSSAEPADSSALAATTPDKTGSTHAAGSGKTPAAGATTKATDPSIAALLNGGPGGPTGGAGGGGGPSAATAALSSSEIEAVVNNRKVGVTRTCWDRNSSALASANVTCHVTIAANGTVSSSSADGSDPVVAKCIETQVKSWTFPPSSGPTQVNLPFHFVRQ